MENIIRKVPKVELEDHEKNLVKLLKSHFGIKTSKIESDVGWSSLSH